MKTDMPVKAAMEFISECNDEIKSGMKYPDMYSQEWASPRYSQGFWEKSTSQIFTWCDSKISKSIKVGVL
jgi:hypothetical protein